MIRLLMTVGFALVTTQAFAQVAVPKSYVDGEVIDADELNTNLEAIAGAVPPRTCTTDQIIKWDGTNDVWVCATDPFAGLNCDVGDQLRMGSGGWECRAEPITASLIKNSWDYQNGEVLPISTYFDSLNNIDTSTTCGGLWCTIKVTGVTDHTSCVVQVTGGAVSGSAVVDITNLMDKIGIGLLYNWNELSAVYINISCTP